VWLVHPGADRWTPLSLSRAFFDRIAAPKRLVVLDAAGHYPVETPGIHQLADAFAEIRDELTSGPDRPVGEVTPPGGQVTATSGSRCPPCPLRRCG
jgi:hypothetical protein